MRHEALVRLCKTGCQNKDGIPIGEDTEVCFQFIFVCIKSPLQAFYVHMSDTCRTLSNQLF